MKFKSATPAEILDRPCYKTDGVTYGSLILNQADGIWACCCKHENDLVHYTGMFPFKYLTCGYCEHTICSDCRTSETLTSLDGVSDSIVAKLMPVSKDEVRGYTVCPDCGLSYRFGKKKGQFYVPGKCYCGYERNSEWPMFYMGSVMEYRRDPPTAQHNAKQELIKRKTEIVKHGKKRTEAGRKLKQKKDAARQGKIAERLRVKEALELQTQAEQRAQEEQGAEQSQRRAQTPRWLPDTVILVQELRWQPPPSAPQPGPLPLQRQASRRRDAGEPSPGICALQRSGAVRGKLSERRDSRSSIRSSIRSSMLDT